MTVYTTIILILFVASLAVQFVMSLEKKCFTLSALFAFELLAFAHLAKVLM